MLRCLFGLDPGTRADELGSITTGMLDATKEPFGDPAEYISKHRALGRGICFDLAQYFPEGSPYRFQSPEEVPDELAFPVLLYLDLEYMSIQELAASSINQVDR